MRLAEARANAFPIDWASVRAAAPALLGRKLFRGYDLAEIARYIDWSPFFQTWDLAGSYPKILDDPVVGEAARNVFADAPGDARPDHHGKMADGERGHRPLPGQRSGRRHRDLRRRESRSEPAMVLAQPAPADEEGGGPHNFCLADFVAPKARAYATTSGRSR